VKDCVDLIVEVPNGSDDRAYDNKIKPMDLHLAVLPPRLKYFCV
jgi:hypothetical protein